MADRNFDDLADRFKRKVYSASKGDIRQDILKRDYQEFLPLYDREKELNIFDAGGGLGQTACYFASLGHQVLLCDISKKMLSLASEAINEQQLSNKVTLLNQTIEKVTDENKEAFDLLSCHAVLEWVDDPLKIIEACLNSVKPEGFLSLTYYNVHGLVYKNLLRTNFKRLKTESWQGASGSLTPTGPLQPEIVNRWMDSLGVNVICESGIRVFHDYILDAKDRARDMNSLKEMEIRYSRKNPFKHLGRYIHLLVQKQ
ncbi:MAG: methyltransferase domain-containing protein [Cellvibrionaceae bacterium]